MQNGISLSTLVILAVAFYVGFRFGRRGQGRRRRFGVPGSAPSCPAKDAGGIGPDSPPAPLDPGLAGIASSV